MSTAIGTLAGWPIVALTTVATEADAERIARSLVEKGLAACVNVVPGVVSFYRWKGALG